MDSLGGAGCQRSPRTLDTDLAASAKCRPIDIEMRNTVDGDRFPNNALIYLQERPCGKLRSVCVTCYEFLGEPDAVFTRWFACPATTVHIRTGIARKSPNCLGFTVRARVPSQLIDGDGCAPPKGSTIANSSDSCGYLDTSEICCNNCRKTLLWHLEARRLEFRT